MLNYYITEFLPQGDTIGVKSCVSSAREDEHTHAYFDIIIPRAGAGHHIIDGKSYEWKCGSVFFVDRATPHAIIPDGDVKYTEILISQDFFESADDSALLRRIFYAENEETPEVTVTEEEAAALDCMINNIESENKKRAGDYRSILRLWFRLMTLYLSRAMERARSELANRDPVYILSVALEYVDKHFTENISQEELAERFHYNSAYFSRMFKKHRGMNLSDYITEKRINYAAELLSGTDLSAEQISEKVGYKSKPQFYNTFIRLRGVTPRQFRLENRK